MKKMNSILSLRAKRGNPTHTLMVLLTMTAVFFSSCSGSNDNAPVVKTGYEGGGSVKAVILNSKTFNPNISHGIIQKFKVTITAPDIETPIEAVFDGTSEAGVIEGIPTGEKRVVKVSAINSNEKSIREGESEEFIVEGGVVAETEVMLEPVPVFANLEDGNVVPNTRFLAKIYSESPEPVLIEDDFEGVDLPLFDLNQNTDKIVPDLSTGQAIFAPAILKTGEHKFTVKNLANGRSSSVTVRIIDGTTSKPAPLFSGGAISESGARQTFGAPTL